MNVLEQWRIAVIDDAFSNEFFRDSFYFWRSDILDLIKSNSDLDRARKIFDLGDHMSEF